MCHGLAETRGHTVHNDFNKVVVSHLGTDIESIDIVLVFLDSTCLSVITYLIKSPVLLAVVALVFPDGVLNLFSGIIPLSVSAPLFQRFSIDGWTNIS